MDNKANPLAFPSVCLNDPGHPSSVPGMTLRDWFAGQALAGLVTSPDVDGGTSGANYARLAYGLADAMLSHRGDPS